MRFRITTAAGQVLDEGQGEAEMIGDALVVSPTFGSRTRTSEDDAGSGNTSDPAAPHPTPAISA